MSAGQHNDEYYFLGLRPLAGYASLKLCHVMSCFCMSNVACAMIWLVRLCMLPTLNPDNAGDAGFLGPIRAPTQKADMGSRASAHQRTQKKQPKNSSPQTRPETQMQQNTVNSSILWLGSRARTRQKARKPTQKKQGPRSTRASHSKSKTDRTTAQRSAQQFLAVFTAFCRARTQHRRHARQRLAPKCAKMSLAYTPPIPT